MNPFNPGAGRKPPYLAGRDEIFRTIKTDMRQVYDQAEGARPIVISGLRGMGKTVFFARNCRNSTQSRLDCCLGRSILC